MELLTLYIALSSLSFLYKSSLPKIENFVQYENAWNANRNLALAMSRDTRIGEILKETDWEKLKDVPPFLDRNGSALSVFSILEEVVRLPEVESIIKLYPEYRIALLSLKDLAIAITENYTLPDMTLENRKKLLAITRMDLTTNSNLECIKGTDNTESEDEGKCLELKNTNTDDLRGLFRDLAPTTTATALAYLQMGFILKLPALVGRSLKIVEDSLSMETVIPIYQVAIATEIEDLKRRAEDYILWEFEDISENVQNFPTLKSNELFSLLMSGKVNVPSENSVFDAIVRWVMADPTTRKETVPNLMKTVRLHHCSISLLNMMLDHQLLAGLESVQQSIRSAISLIELSSPKLQELVKQEQRHLHETIFVIGYPQIKPSGGAVETYSIPKQDWIHQPHLNFTKIQYGTRTVAIDHTIFVFPSEDYSVNSFDPIKKELKFLSTVPSQHNSFAVAVLSDKIYVLAGRRVNRGTNICQIFNTKTGEWTKMPSLSTSRENAAAATLKGIIYLSGGRESSKQEKSVLAFDPNKKRWTSIAPLNVARERHGLVTEGDYLWAFGGNAEAILGGNTKYVERYDPEVGTWNIITQMPTSDYTLQVAYFSGNFLTMGGYYNDHRVDVYNPRRKTWNMISDLQLGWGRFAFGSSVVKDLPNAYDYI